MTKYIVVGAGGHARVVIDALKSTGRAVVGCVDPKLAKGSRIDGVRVLGGDDALTRHATGSVKLANGVGGAHSTQARRRLYEKLRGAGYSFPPVKAASAHLSDSAKLHSGCQLLTRAVVHPGSVIGENTVVNTGAIVEHGCVVGAHCFIGPGAILCGDVLLEEGVFVGTGALIMPGVRIGAGAHIGAGSIVKADVSKGEKVRP